jgi:hypothetical protein
LDLLKIAGGAVERLNKASQSREFGQLIDGLFSQIGLEVLDTREKLTCRHQGDHVDVREGVDPDQVDFHLKLYSYQIDRLIENARTGYQDPLARFRLTREFLDALPHYVSRLLNNSVVTNSAFRNLIHAKDLIHVHLVSPDSSQEPDVTYTLFFVNGAWHVTKGLVGNAERVFKLSADDGLDLMRHGHQATKCGLAQIPKFAQWYVDWRKKVEVKTP